MPSEQNSANCHSNNECELHDVRGYHFDFDEADQQPIHGSSQLTIRIIEPEDLPPQMHNPTKLVRFQAKPGATAEEIHEALQATLAAHAPVKKWSGPRDVTGTPDGGDRRIIGAGPPPD